jgi:hypothetical protein
MASGWSGSWLSKQWADIRGNVKWDAIKLGGGGVIAGAYLLLQKIPCGQGNRTA